MERPWGEVREVLRSLDGWSGRGREAAGPGSGGTATESPIGGPRPGRPSDGRLCLKMPRMTAKLASVARSAEKDVL